MRVFRCDARCLSAQGADRHVLQHPPHCRHKDRDDPDKLRQHPVPVEPFVKRLAAQPVPRRYGARSQPITARRCSAESPAETAPGQIPWHCRQTPAVTSTVRTKHHEACQQQSRGFGDIEDPVGVDPHQIFKVDHALPAAFLAARAGTMSQGTPSTQWLVDDHITTSAIQNHRLLKLRNVDKLENTQVPVSQAAAYL